MSAPGAAASAPGGLRLEDVVACPSCGGRGVALVDGVWACAECGPVGHERLGFPDFTNHPAPLAVANAGVFDLVADAERAAQLLAFGDVSFERLWAEQQQVAFDGDAERSRAVANQTARYNKVEQEAGDRHGDALLDKVDAHLTAATGSGLPGSGLALEAAGGLGKFVSGFRRRFDGVVFVDCSLANLVLARRLATESGLSEVLFVRADVTRLPFASGTFAFVHENGVIEHVHDPVSMIREADRVLADGGVYACLSPNRYPITPEPHFRLALFGAFPPPLRRALVLRTRGVASEAGTDLRSLRDLRRFFRQALRVEPDIFFLPASLPSLARHTPVRRAVQRALSSPVAGRVVRGVANGVALGVMPYHLAVVRKEGSRP